MMTGYASGFQEVSFRLSERVSAAGTHSQGFHQQTIAEAFIAENFMRVVGGHRYKAKQIPEHLEFTL